jgi:protein N-terminal glutamine amidohydrolase
MSAWRHHPMYCEENIWHLCQDQAIDRVVFITNAARRVALWHQRAAPPDQPIVWDYHVIATAGAGVYDLDSRLSCPVGPHEYLAATFATVGIQPPQYDPRFAVVEAEAYVRQLRSDRRHMRRADGSWQAPPPPWPAIGEGSNLGDYLAAATLELGELTLR